MRYGSIQGSEKPFSIACRSGISMAPGLTQLAVSSSRTFNTTAAHDLQMNFQGSLISVYWDGTFLMSATDSTYPSGFVCLDADNQPISYSNIQVAALQNQVSTRFRSIPPA